MRFWETVRGQGLLHITSMFVCLYFQLPYSKGNPVVGAVGEMAYMKRRKLWRMGCVAPAVPSKLGWAPRHCQKNGVKSPLFCCFFCVVGYPSNWGKRPRYIYRFSINLQYHSFFFFLDKSSDPVVQALVLQTRGRIPTEGG